jgi:hypothetical protein
VNDDADGFTEAALRFCPGCHAHRSSQFPSRPPHGGRTFCARESPLVSRQQDGLDADIESEFWRKPEFARLDVLPRAGCRIVIPLYLFV